MHKYYGLPRNTKVTLPTSSPSKQTVGVVLFVSFLCYSSFVAQFGVASEAPTLPHTLVALHWVAGQAKKDT